MKKTTLHIILKSYWKIYWEQNIESFRIDKRLFFFKETYRKTFTKTTSSIKGVVFWRYSKKIRFNPYAYEESERLFEEFMRWKVRKLEHYLQKYPQLLRKQIRHKKVPAYKLPLRL